MRRGRAVLRAMAAKPALDEPRLDQLFTEPIVQQFMHRDRIDEATKPAACCDRRPSLEQRRPRRGPRDCLPSR
jgi:hypothetical protein